MNCIKCARPLKGVEAALHKKMINRAAEEHMCITCMADFFNCSEELLYSKIEAYRKAGCVLFPVSNGEKSDE